MNSQNTTSNPGQSGSRAAAIAQAADAARAEMKASGNWPLVLPAKAPAQQEPVNARLIAAAPVLYAALQQAQMALIGFVGKGRNQIIADAIEAAEAALAQADGKEAGR